MALSNSDYDLLLDISHQICEETDFAALPQRMIDLISQIVPCEVAAYNAMDDQTKEMTAVHNHPDPGLVDRLFPTLMAYSHEHPVYANHIETGCMEPRKFTDFLSQQQFERTTVFNEFFRKVVGVKLLL